MKRIWRAVLVTGAVSAVAVLAFVGAANAHVTVNPNSATQGGYTRIAFRVPTESDTASTTKLEVNLPTDQPVASVLVMPVPGWTAQLNTTKLATPITTDDGDKVTEAISQIVWTADSADTAIKPGQFQEFPVSLGPLPKAASMTFKALQTYSDGTIVRWIDLTTPGQAEPDHPAPVLTLTAGTGDAPAAATGGASAAPTADAAASNSSGTPALVVAIIAVVLGVAGAALGGLAFTRSRRSAA
jgi:uncharacterized protein YcnI